MYQIIYLLPVRNLAKGLDLSARAPGIWMMLASVAAIAAIMGYGVVTTRDHAIPQPSMTMANINNFNQ